MADKGSDSDLARQAQHTSWRTLSALRCWIVGEKYAEVSGPTRLRLDQVTGRLPVLEM